MTVTVLWLHEKVFTDCVSGPQFRACGQLAMVAPLGEPREANTVLHYA